MKSYCVPGIYTVTIHHYIEPGPRGTGVQYYHASLPRSQLRKSASSSARGCAFAFLYSWIAVTTAAFNEPTEASSAHGSTAHCQPAMVALFQWVRLADKTICRCPRARRFYPSHSWSRLVKPTTSLGKEAQRKILRGPQRLFQALQEPLHILGGSQNVTTSGRILYCPTPPSLPPLTAKSKPSRRT